MSKIALTPNASGTGTFTLASPATNTDRTLTLPDSTGTVNISGLANEVPTGSVSAPSIYPTGDTNTGIFFPAADTVAVTTGGTERMRVDSSGNVGIGTGSSLSKLEVNGGAANTYVRIVDTRATYPTYIGAEQGSTVFGRWGLSESMRIDSSGVVTITNLAGAGSRTVTAGATGILAAASDSRLKQEVLETPIAGLAEIMQLRPVAYKWLDDIENRGDDAAVELGFFADEAKDVIPSAAPMGNDGYYGFYDRAVIAALVKAVQEQQAIITALETRIAALEVI